MNIGIFGGTFNPVHNGHINLAGCYKEILKLDKIIFVPTSTPPHKLAKNLANDKDRINMLKWAIKGIDGFELSTMELERQGKSYTYDTIVEYKELHPDDNLFLIVGSDMFLSFHKWYKYKEMLKLVILCTAARDGNDNLFEMRAYADKVLKIDQERYFISRFPVVIASSSSVRENLKRGLEIKALVPESVENYILENGIYFSDKLLQFKALAKSRLSEYRYYHSLCVADAAKKLAKKYGADEKKAYLAGILHDIMKEEAPAIQLQWIVKSGIMLSDLEKKSQKLYHAMAGEAYCRMALKFEDEEVLSAIRYHTTGKKDMTLLEKVLFVADFISKDRNYDDVEIMRFKSSISLESAIHYAMGYTIQKLTETGALIHPDTTETYNQMIKEKLEKE